MASQRSSLSSTSCAGPPVDVGQLRVVAKATAGPVGPFDLRREQFAGERERAGVGHDDDRGRPESRKRGAADHDPPETTTAGPLFGTELGACAGGCRRGGALVGRHERWVRGHHPAGVRWGRVDSRNVRDELARVSGARRERRKDTRQCGGAGERTAGEQSNTRGGAITGCDRAANRRRVGFHVVTLTRTDETPMSRRLSWCYARSASLGESG